MAGRQGVESTEAFCREYVSNGYNATQAYLKVHPNANYNTAKTKGNLMMKDPKIRGRVDELIQDQYNAMSINAERIAMKLAEMAFAEKGDEEYTPQVVLKALDMLQKQLGLQKQNVKQEVDQVTTIQVNVVEDD